MEKIISLKKNREFKKVFSKGKSIVEKLLVVYFYKNESLYNRIGIVVNKKVGNAVVRNRVKRVIKECYRSYGINLKKGFDIVIVARVRASDASYSDINNAIKRLLKKTGLSIDVTILERKNNGEKN